MNGTIINRHPAQALPYAVAVAYAARFNKSDPYSVYSASYHMGQWYVAVKDKESGHFEGYV